MIENAQTIPFHDAASVTRATPMPVLIAALDAAFASGSFQSSPRLTANMGDSSLLVMPAWQAGQHIGTKVVIVNPTERPSVRSTYLLVDCASGKPIAAMDGATLTRRRTAAASVLAARYLARKDSTTLFIIGTGAMNASLIEAYASTFELNEILIWGRDPIKAKQAAIAARAKGYPASAIRTIEEGLSRTDIVSAATLATSPLIFGAALKPGTHIDLIGAFRPDMSEADPEAFARASLFVDTREGALTEAGDLLQAIASGAITSDAIEADVAALCKGRHSGRDGDQTAITLFKSVGTAIEDLVAAELISIRTR